MSDNKQLFNQRIQGEAPDIDIVNRSKENTAESPLVVPADAKGDEPKDGVHKDGKLEDGKLKEHELKDATLEHDTPKDNTPEHDAPVDIGGPPVDAAANDVVPETTTPAPDLGDLESLTLDGDGTPPPDTAIKNKNKAVDLKSERVQRLLALPWIPRRTFAAVLPPYYASPPDDPTRRFRLGAGYESDDDPDREYKWLTNGQ